MTSSTIKVSHAGGEPSRIPLVLTYHPLNERVKGILRRNFTILSDDPQTKEIFPQPRDRNIRDTLVTLVNFVFAWYHLLVHAPAAAPVTLQGPKCSIVITNTFTCQSTGQVYATSIHRCSAIYVGETGRHLGNGSASICPAARGTCRNFLSQSISIPMVIPYKRYKYGGSCSAKATNNANARKCV